MVAFVGLICHVKMFNHHRRWDMVSFISLFQYRKFLTGLYKELEEERSASVDAYIDAGKGGELAHEETMIIIGALV
ncbi:unnamed protein product [Brassica napus]|uniref:(rape) hypothetical protein n=1 Tax=Brassica napus TaxID=3708 RepID=A0A816WHZ8_BRANA|nr:unnamed protein product [Brassica napus]